MRLPASTYRYSSCMLLAGLELEVVVVVDVPPLINY